MIIHDLLIMRVTLVDIIIITMMMKIKISTDVIIIIFMMVNGRSIVVEVGIT